MKRTGKRNELWLIVAPLNFRKKIEWMPHSVLRFLILICKGLVILSVSPNCRAHRFWLPRTFLRYPTCACCDAATKNCWYAGTAHRGHKSCAEMLTRGTSTEDQEEAALVSGVRRERDRAPPPPCINTTLNCHPYNTGWPNRISHQKIQGIGFVDITSFVPWSTECQILLGLVRIGQKWQHQCWARFRNFKKKVNKM